jgi:hypothetical protein
MSCPCYDSELEPDSLEEESQEYPVSDDSLDNVGE